MNSVCRLCFGVKGVEVPIFGESNEIYEKLTSCLSIKVCNIDQLSKKICYTCSDKVEEFFVFRRTALDVEKRLCSLVLDTNGENALQITEQMDSVFFIKPEISEDLVQITNLSKATQTDAFSLCHVNVKQEVDGSVCSERSYINDTLDFPESNVPHSEDAANSTLGESHSRSRRKSRRPRKNKKEPAEMEALSQMFNSDEDNTALINLAPVKKEEAPDSPLNLITGTIWDDVEKKEELDEDQSDEKLCCCVCYEFKSTKTEMIAHYRTHKHEAENKMSIGVNTGKIRPDEDGFYECTICKKSYDKKPRFLEHIAVHKTVRSRPFQCSLCEKTFTEVVQILKHGKTHTYENCIVENCPTAHRGICPSDHLSMNKATPRPVTKRFICDICNEGFVYMRYLKFHRSKLHPEAKGQLVIRCMQCSKEFSHLNSLRRHLRSHSGEKNFLCYICGKALSSKEHLKFHISIHTGHKPHICKTCGKGFVKKCNLILHERVHSGERPHVCSHCGKAFSQRSTLVIHERYHSGARPYVCTLCNKGFVARGLLSMHLKTTCI